MGSLAAQAEKFLNRQNAAEIPIHAKRTEQHKVDGIAIRHRSIAHGVVAGPELLVVKVFAIVLAGVGQEVNHTQKCPWLEGAVESLARPRRAISRHCGLGPKKLADSHLEAVGISE